MGKPIQKKWFGLPLGAGSGHITVTGIRFADNTTTTSGYIVKQTGSNAYLVQDAALSHAAEIVFMVNANGLAALLPGQCYINATPFGGSPLPCAKINQYRVDIYDVANTVAQEVGSPAVSGVTSFSWSTIPAVTVGQADLVTGVGVVGEILSVTVNTAGFGYFSAPAITFTGAGGTGGTAHATIAAGAITAIVVDTAGFGYADGGVGIAAPTAAVTALAHATIGAGAVASLVVDTAGGYYTVAPTVTIGGPGTGASATAVISGGHVTGFTSLVGGTGYVSIPTVTLSAPAASVQATATATISVD